MIEFKEPKKAVEWVIHRTRDFSVIVRGWKSGDEFKWNVYAYVFDTHPLFGKVEALMAMPFHGGPTYDRFFNSSPAAGIKYEWQKEDKYYKIGSDYSHCYDNYENDSYEDGIPTMIRYDAQELAQHLFDCQSEESSCSQVSIGP
jgi:hypothetical protein